MDIFNLNSDSYTNNEIENLLHLSLPYSINDVNLCKTKLINEIGSMNNLGNDKLEEIIQFINKITSRVQDFIKIPMLQNHRVIQQGSNFIIEKPDSIIGKESKNENGRMALESNTAPPGYINPISVRTITQAISIDSRFRPNYYSTKSTNFNVILPSIQKNVISMRVSSIELPMTYYAVSRYNENSTCIIINLSEASEGWLLTLPDGNYEQSWANNSNAASIAHSLNDAILNALPVSIEPSGNVTLNSSGTNLNSGDLLYTLDQISGKSYFTAGDGGILFTSGFKIRFNVDTDGNLKINSNLQMRLGWQLGFRFAEYTCIPRCISEGICLVCGPRYGFISIDDHQKNTGPAYIVAYANSILQDNIITRINLAELQADVGVYQSSSDPGLSNQLNRTREYFGPVDIQKLHITFYDEYGRVIDLNNMDWSFSLSFEILYN